MYIINRNVFIFRCKDRNYFRIIANYWVIYCCFGDKIVPFVLFFDIKVLFFKKNVSVSKKIYIFAHDF